MRKTIVICLSLLILISCRAKPERYGELTPTIDDVNNTSTQELTITAKPTSTFTIVPPTETNSPVPSRTHTHTPDVTKTPSITPLPTFADPSQMIRNYYTTNGGCRLPCWWGITPGEISRDQVFQHFSQFSDYVLVIDGSNNELFVSFPPLNRGVDYWIMTRLELDNDIVQSVILDTEAAIWGGFMPRDLIAKYGHPPITLYTGETLIMFYEDLHINAEFHLFEEETEYGVHTCLTGLSKIITWFSEEETVRQIQKISARLSNQNYDEENVSITYTYNQKSERGQSLSCLIIEE
jgi:hypothetical protein